MADQAVELQGGPSPRTGKTDQAGRAEFPGLPVGLRVRAVAVVDGERLESQEFEVPASGGIRVALVAGLGAAPGGAGQAAAPQASAQPGAVLLGEQSRLVFEVGDDGLNVFNVFQILNPDTSPVQPSQPLVFDLPPDSQGAGLMDGSTPQGVLSGKQVVVNGPFAPGSTLVQFAYTMPFGSPSIRVDLKMPAALDHVAVVVQKVGPMRIESPQIGEQRDMPAEGQTYIAARGPGLKAGDTLSLTVSGVPHEATWPRNLALTLAVLILGAGTVISLRSRRAAVEGKARREKLEAKRDALFGELTSLEEQLRNQTIDAGRYASRRRDLVSALERLYAQLDEDAAA